TTWTRTSASAKRARATIRSRTARPHGPIPTIATSTRRMALGRGLAGEMDEAPRVVERVHRVVLARDRGEDGLGHARRLPEAARREHVVIGANDLAPRGETARPAALVPANRVDAPVPLDRPAAVDDGLDQPPRERMDVEREPDHLERPRDLPAVDRLREAR